MHIILAAMITCEMNIIFEKKLKIIGLQAEDGTLDKSPWAGNPLELKWMASSAALGKQQIYTDLFASV